MGRPFGGPVRDADTIRGICLYFKRRLNIVSREVRLINSLRKKGGRRGGPGRGNFNNRTDDTPGEAGKTKGTKTGRDITDCDETPDENDTVSGS